MSDTYILKRGCAARLPALADTAALREASADDLRVLLCLALEGYSASVNRLADLSGLTLSRAAAAVEYWLGTGLISQGAAHTVEEALPRGSAADDARVIGELELRDCLEGCSAILGKLLNPSEIGILVAIINDLGVSQSYLITLLDFCVNTLGKRGVKYLEKVALSMADKGITTDQALDEYIKNYELIHSNEGQIRRLWGLGSRALTQREQDMLYTWFHTWGFSMEMIGRAYDLTAESAAKVTLAYTHKILEDWHTQGLKDLAAVEAYLAEKREAGARATTPARSKPKKAAGLSSTSFDVDDFFSRALQRSYDPSKKEDE